MIVSNEKYVKVSQISAPGYANIVGKVLVSSETGWDDYVMRVFQVSENGYSGRHSHDYPHIVYTLEGTGTLFLDGKDYPIESGSFTFIPPNKEHQLSNKGKDDLKFICIVPKRGHLGFDD
ncbi:cupin domain-containing protein [Clostridium sp.]|uniref:cupin domain-containing protein n=1 Tax=Clostridium sp. TaxID=1506 RepID=UPI001A504D83|nr:cupin domain-containing protein [Clostridium sp.]MBK5239646.1 cupin domain-containing protein [Clostridium sp.]